MFNFQTGERRDYEVYNKHTDEVDDKYGNRRKAQAAVDKKKEAGDYSWRIRTLVTRA